MSYQLKINPKARRSARFISRLQKKIQRALVESGMTQQQVAEKLGVDRSVINRRLSGKANLTARSIAEFAYAFDKEVDLDFVGRAQEEGRNWASATGNVVDISRASIAARGTIEPTEKYYIERAAS